MLYSNNEWDQLKRVIVGDATLAHWPVNCSFFRSLEHTSSWTETELPKGPVNPTVIRESNEDLANLSKTLTGLGVEVVRPKKLDFQSFDGMYNYCPRDRLLVVGDKVIDCPMTYPTRFREIEALRDYIDVDIIECDDGNAIFDAANICRLGKDLLYLVSKSGNLAGAKWLQRMLGDTYRVHIIDNIYSGVHIDSTISPVREGLVVINGDRVNHTNIPKVLTNWDKIMISGDEIVNQSFADYPYASNYIAINLLSIDGERVICDPKQINLINKLNEYNVEVFGVDLRHSRTLGGGHHCVTLDLQRG